MTNYLFPKLSDEKQFEHLVRDCYRALYPHAQVDDYGIRGQKQNGIDITVQTESELICIQCKNYEKISTSDVDKLLNQCTYHDINPFHKLIIATAAPKDTKIIDYLIKVRRTRNLPFDLEYLPWEEICRLIEMSPSVYQNYFGELKPDMLKNKFLEVVKKYQILDFLRIDPLIEGIYINIIQTLDNVIIELEALLDQCIERKNDELYLLIKKFEELLDSYSTALAPMLQLAPSGFEKLIYIPPINKSGERNASKEQSILHYRRELTQLVDKIATYM